MSGNPVGWEAAPDRFEDASTAGDAGQRMVGPGGIEPRRLREVLDRLQAGFYDSPRVRRHIAERVAVDLDTE